MLLLNLFKYYFSMYIVSGNMRVSEGIPKGRFVKLHNPKLFQEHEEVIIFTRDDLNRRIYSIIAEIDNINKINMNFDRSEEWKLIGIWPKIMQSVQHIDLNMDLILKKEPIQAYLDTYLYNDIQSSKKKVAVSKSMIPINIGQTKLL